MSIDRCDVVVCGAGVGGLTAAIAFAAAGHRVSLLEKRIQPARVAKGEVLQPSSVGVLRDMGVLPGLAGRGAVELDRLVVRTAEGQAVMVFDYPGLAGPDRTLLSLDYHEIVAALTDALPDSVRQIRGAVVDELCHDDTGRISGVGYTAGATRSAVHAPLVVAADGLSSRLRKLAGLAADPVEYPHRLMSFELADTAGAPAEVTAYVTGRGLRLTYPLPHHRLRLYVQATPEFLRQTVRNGLDEWCAGLADDAPALRPLLGPLRDGLASRQVLSMWRFTAPRLCVPGLALVGESAHSVHPMAAQGMNTAIADGAALAAAVGAGPLRPDTVDNALFDYQGTRSKWIKHVDLMSHDATRMITMTSWPGRQLGRWMLRNTNGNPRLRRIATYNLAGLGIRPFTLVDRLHQLGLPDPLARRAGVL